VQLNAGLGYMTMSMRLKLQNKKNAGVVVAMMQGFLVNKKGLKWPVVYSRSEVACGVA